MPNLIISTEKDVEKMESKKRQNLYMNFSHLIDYTIDYYFRNFASFVFPQNNSLFNRLLIFANA